MSEEYEDKINNDESNEEVIEPDVIREESSEDNNGEYDGQVQDSEVVSEEQTSPDEGSFGPDGRYGYTKDNMPYSETSYNENDYRNADSYNGYSNNNGYTNSDYSGGGYGSQTAEESKVNKSIDKRAAKAAKKAAKQQKKSEQRLAKQQKKQQGGGFSGKAVKFVAAAVLFGVIAGGVMIGIGYYGYDYYKESTDKSVSKTQTSTSVNADVMEETETETNVNTSEGSDNQTSGGKVIITDVSDIVDEVMPSVVAITSTEIIQSASNDFWSYFYGNGSGSGGQYESQGAGSGIIVGESDTELLIVTNQHVVSDADSLSVQFVDGKSVEATVRGENEKQDIAVISIPLSELDKETIDAIKIATLGDSDKVKVGEGSIAIGNALGYGQSVTTGVISALDRTITVDNNERTVLQTDAAINPGNSGGALLNMKGEVIGINVAKSVENYSEGMGYTIPISQVKDLIDDMMSKEVKDKVSEEEKGYLNIRGKDVTQELSDMYDIPEGIYIMEIMEGGAAQKAGLSKYDVITEIDGDIVSSMEELQEALSYYKKGEKVKLVVETLKGNEYTEREIEVELGGEMN